MTKGFVAYPSVPASVRDVVNDSIRVINASYALEIETWEKLAIGGRMIIDEICRKIDDASLFIADLTGLNLNVLYELGYAIGRNKRVWILYDDTFVDHKWQDFRLLSSIGYRASTNSEGVIRHFAADRPDMPASTLFERHVAPALRSSSTAKILYLKCFHQTNASTQITRRIEKSSIPVTSDDPREVISQPLTWYAEHVGACTSVVCHFDNPARSNVLVRNATVAFVAGLAHALDKRVLLLTEGDYLSPLDYRDRLRHYSNAAKAYEATDAWLLPLEDERQEQEASRVRTVVEKQRHLELRTLKLGEYIAENEEPDLLSEYFVETNAFHEALGGAQANLLFIGRKGAGKSANYIRLVDSFARDVRNVVCQVKPPSYELSALVEVLRRFLDKDQKQFVIEGLWRFLVYAQIVDEIVVRLARKPRQAWSEEEERIAKLHREKRDVFEGDLALRLEALTSRLEQVELSGAESLAEFRSVLARALYGDLIGELKDAILGAVPRGARIRVLVDNLDKSWERDSDLQLLAEFLLGLLSATSKIAHEMSGVLRERGNVLSLVVFLRADIFDRIRSVAREPDKLRFQRLEWNDREMLLRLIEERYAALQDDETPGGLWKRYFSSGPQGMSPQDYILRTALPKPRDVLYLLSAAIATAVNRRRGRVEAADLEEAAKKYSEFAFDALTIEDLSYEGPVAHALIELAGKNVVVDSALLIALLKRGGATHADEAVLERLCVLSVLMPEVRDGQFMLVEDYGDLRRKMVQARDLASSRGQPVRYRVHPAFSTFLEMQDV